MVKIEKDKTSDFTVITEAWNRSRNEFDANKGIKDLKILKEVKKINDLMARLIHFLEN